LGKGALRIFGELYQIIFHLGRLGYHSADHACRANGGTRAWRAYSRLVSTAVAVLTEPVPALNLLLLAIALVSLPGLLGDHWRGRVGLLTLAVMLLALLGLAFFQAGRRVKGAIWALPPLLLLGSVAVAIALPMARLTSPRIPSWRLVGFEASLIGFGLVAMIVRVYDRRRPGTLRTTAVLGTALAVILWWHLWRAPETRDGILVAGLRAAEIGGVLLTASFTAIFALTLLAVTLGYVLARWRSAERHAAVRATGTARLGLSIATGAFLVLTLTVWASLFAARESLIPATTTYEPYLPWPADLTPACPERTARAFLDQLLFGFVEYTGTLPAFALIAAALVLAAWAVLPVALAEVVPPRDPARTASRYGTWLDRGFKLAAGSGFLLFAAVFVAMPLADRIAPSAVLPFLTTCVSADGLLKAAALVGTAVVGVSVARGRFEHLALGLRPLVDVALDVDNHLREHPWRANPRARIAARYLSTLRALADYEDVIIVAHSQGSAITADLLRFLKYENIAAPPRVWLFTMGCPLRQLYSERFPQLYDWAARPDPLDIRVHRWVNAYRTGDYVGRALWEPAAPPDRAEDVCIGGGAHTHYWDGTSDEIGARLDALVVEAARG
jgi:hypothetical protein